MNFSIIDEKFEEAKKTIAPEISFTKHHQDFEWFKDAAEKGIIGCYHCFNVLEGRERYFFYPKGAPEYNECPMLVEIDKTKLPMEFGMIKRKIDAEDLSKRGIISQFSTVSVHFEKIMIFIKSYVTKSHDDSAARKAIKTLFNRGLIISPPLQALSIFNYIYDGLIVSPLKIGWADYICPRCDSEIRILSQDDKAPECAGITCPRCQTKFGTKS